MRTFFTATVVWLLAVCSASAATIDLTYSGVLTSGSSDGIGIPSGSIAGDWAVINLTFDTTSGGTYTSSQGSSSYAAQGINAPAASFEFSLYASASGPLLAQTITGGTVAVDMSTIGFTQQSITASGTTPQTNPPLFNQTIVSSSVFNPAISGDITQNLLLSNIDLAVNFSLIINSSPALSGSLDFGNFQSSTTGETPIPATLPLFASGLAALGLLGWRKRRRMQAAA